MQRRHNRHYRDRVLLCTGHCASEKAQSEYIVSRDTRRRLWIANTLLGLRERCGGSAGITAPFSVPCPWQGTFYFAKNTKKHCTADVGTGTVLYRLHGRSQRTDRYHSAESNCYGDRQSRHNRRQGQFQYGYRRHSKRHSGAGTTAKTDGAKSGTPTGGTAAKAKGGSGKSTTTTRAANSAKWQGGSAGLIPHRRYLPQTNHAEAHHQAAHDSPVQNRDLYHYGGMQEYSQAHEPAEKRPRALCAERRLHYPHRKPHGESGARLPTMC